MRIVLNHTAASWLAVVRAATHEPSGYQRLWVETYLVLPPAADAMIRNRNAPVIDRWVSVMERWA